MLPIIEKVFNYFLGVILSSSVKLIPPVHISLMQHYRRPRVLSTNLFIMRDNKNKIFLSQASYRAWSGQGSSFTMLPQSKLITPQIYCPVPQQFKCFLFSWIAICINKQQHYSLLLSEQWNRSSIFPLPQSKMIYQCDTLTEQHKEAA